MIKTLLMGAAVGYFGKKLYDAGKLDPFVAKAKSKFGAGGQAEAPIVPQKAKKGGKGQPDLAF